jgi:hypothetical protein
MKKIKLKKFTEFANSLLPHETQYLLKIQQFEDEQRLEILKRVDYNCRQIDQKIDYDESIDKRKYSNLKNWILLKLATKDIDEQFAWMSSLEQKINFDRITLDEEKKLLKATRQFQYPDFYFSKFYELLQRYRHFLQVRFRYSDHQVVDQFLIEHADAYHRATRVSEQIHEATNDIIKQYANNSVESIQWEKWLSDIFYDEQLEGNLRYMALIRLTIISNNYGKYQMLLSKFEYLDKQFSDGSYYSKRLLINYYYNRTILHIKLGETEKAIYYGELSVREKNHDYIIYVNNYCSTLIKAKRYEQALQLMRKASPDLKLTKNFHSRIGFVSFYVKCLIKNEHFKNARNYAEVFLDAYEKEIFAFRWHRFFSVYIEALLLHEDFRAVIIICHRYQLIDKEKKFANRASYVPLIQCFHMLAQFKTKQIDRYALSHFFTQELQKITPRTNWTSLEADLQDGLRQTTPWLVVEKMFV